MALSFNMRDVQKDTLSPINYLQIYSSLIFTFFPKITIIDGKKKNIDLVCTIVNLNVILNQWKHLLPLY